MACNCQWEFGHSRECPEYQCSECGVRIENEYIPDDWAFEHFMKLPFRTNICSEKCLINFLGK